MSGCSRESRTALEAVWFGVVEPQVQPPGEQAPEEELARAEKEESVWYLDPFWLIVALIFVVVVVILIFSGRKR